MKREVKFASGWLLPRLLWLCAVLLSGCAGAVRADRDAVAVTAVNYTGRELNAVLFIDPQNDQKVAGGPGVDPYSGNGAMCCYALPRRWRPGIQVKLRYDWWTGSSYDRRYETIVRELPPYPTDEPGVLWALFYEDGSVEVLASAVDPGHPQWPGKLKHWPIPSREHRLKLWQMEYDRVARGISYYEELIKGPSAARLEEIWKHLQRYSPNELKGFSGPNDPRFNQAIREEGERALRTRRAWLEQLEKSKP